MNADIDEDNFLNESEYLAFLHPELNSVSLNRLCDKILMHLDRDMDGKLTENEFVDKSNSPKVEIVTPYPGFVLTEEDENISVDNDITRRKYFKEQIDTNHDGMADRVELLVSFCLYAIMGRRILLLFRDFCLLFYQKKR